MLSRTSSRELEWKKSSDQNDRASVLRHYSAEHLQVGRTSTSAPDLPVRLWLTSA
jgi:hypothetical protein